MLGVNFKRDPDPVFSLNKLSLCMESSDLNTLSLLASVAQMQKQKPLTASEIHICIKLNYTCMLVNRSVSIQIC